MKRDSLFGWLKRLSPLSLSLLLGAVLGIILAIIVLLGGGIIGEVSAGEAVVTPQLIVMINPSATPIPPTALPATFMPQSTALPTLEAGAGTGFGLGDLVEVTGTGGDGLRLRQSPGLDSKIISLGVDSEVFKVEDGPQTVDGYQWWYLINPYDSTRQGWAVGRFLKLLGQ
jgi:hypothetical protein